MERFVTTFSATGRQFKQTCKQCRFRKVRCDGNHGEKGCGDCDRLNFECSFLAPPDQLQSPPNGLGNVSTSGSADGDEPLSSPRDRSRPVERRRTSKACVNCRQQKVRCSGGVPCMTCNRRGAACTYQSDRRRGSRVAIARSTTSDGGTAEDDGGQMSVDEIDPTLQHTQPVSLPPDIQALVDSYFAQVYPLPSYAFLHPQTTKRYCAEGKLDSCLAYAISAVANRQNSALHINHDREVGWIQAAEGLVWQHLESPTVARLQALLLIILYRVETGSFQRAFMLSALATRAAAAMRLNHERPGLQGDFNHISLEVRRRLMWSLKLVERYFSTGLPEFELCPVENIYLELPSWELEFSSNHQLESGRTLTSCDFGSYHLCVRLEMLRRDIMKLTRSLALCDTTSPQLPTVMHDFEQHLERVSQQLPNGLTLSSERISQLLTSPWLPRQILVHLSYHQCQCDLYRLLLRKYREAAPASVLDTIDVKLLEEAENMCLTHATAIIDILTTLNQQSRHSQLLEFDTAICGYHATRLLLFISQFGSSSSRPSEEWALSRAELCLAALRRFFPTSLLVKPVIEEMRRAITVFSSQSPRRPTPSRLASPGPNSTNGQRDASANLSDAARVRQRLAIHSLLRQADFTDDDDEQENVSPSNGYVTHSGTNTVLPSPMTPRFATCQGQAGTTGSDTASSPGAPSDGGDAWQHRFLLGYGSAGGWDAEPPHQITGTRPPSFSFPWLQRWGGDGIPT